MKLEKFRIKNYKSIIDSGDCYLESDMTIFAGRNESGKSSILEALFDFNVDRTISMNNVSLGKSDNSLEISLTLAVSTDIVKKLVNNNGGNQAYESLLNFTVTKKINNDYVIPDAIAELFNLSLYRNKDMFTTQLAIISEMYADIEKQYIDITSTYGGPTLFDFIISDLSYSIKNMIYI